MWCNSGKEPSNKAVNSRVMHTSSITQQAGLNSSGKVHGLCVEAVAQQQDVLLGRCSIFSKSCMEAQISSTAELEKFLTNSSVPMALPSSLTPCLGSRNMERAPWSTA